MGEGNKDFTRALEGALNGRVPTEEQLKVGGIAHEFYMDMRGGGILSSVRKTVLLYTQVALPELSREQVEELIHTTHTIIETVLTYLVEDGLIKED